MSRESITIGPSVTVRITKKNGPVIPGGQLRWRDRATMRIVDSVPPGRYQAENGRLHDTEVVLTFLLSSKHPSDKHAYVVTRAAFDAAFPKAKLPSWDEAQRLDAAPVGGS